MLVPAGPGGRRPVASEGLRSLRMGMVGSYYMQY